MGAHQLSTNGVGADPIALDDSANRDAILAQLNKILTHSTFKDTKRLKRFLEYVVMETLDGRGGRLKGYTLGLEVFDRPDDFDPQGDTIVRVQAGQLRRRLDLYYAKDGHDDPVRILMPKGRYEPVFELRRAVVTELAKHRSNLHFVSENDLLACPGILVPSIANLSGDTEYKYFAEGLTSEIVNALVQFRYLRVITGTPMVDTTTPMTNKDVAEIYDAQFILSGSVRRAKNLTRISVNLINAATGAHLLTKTFDRNCSPDCLFEVQEEIASYVAAAVATSSGAINRYNRRRRTARGVGMQGYDALLKFFDIRSDHDVDAFKDLIAEFDAILKTTPNFSSGWAAQSLLYSGLVAGSYLDGDPSQAKEAAIIAARRAVTAHSENALARYASSMANFYSGKFEQYEKDAAMAIAYNPNDYTVLLPYAMTRLCLGDFEGAKTYDDAAQALISLPAHWNMSVKSALSMMEGHYEFAAEQLGYLTPRSNKGTVMLALACAGYAGEYEGIQQFKKTILDNNIDYGRRTLHILKRWHPRPDVYEKIRKGFELAGFDVVPE